MNTMQPTTPETHPDTHAPADHAPLDSAASAAAAFDAVHNQPFPEDIFTAPELKWAVIGCGVIAHQMAEVLALAGRHLYAVHNRTQEKAERFAERYGVEHVYATLDELLADPAVDALYITTPHNTHIRYLRAALTAGKHVLCEKSITLNAAELTEARELAAAHQVQLMDATTILHMPLYQVLLGRMRAGEFGQLSLAQVNFGSFKEFGDLTNRFYNPRLAGGAMLDIGVYALSILRLFMASQPDEVVSLANRATTGVDQTAGIVLRNAEGQIATVTMSLHAKLPKRTVLSFERCYIEVDNYPRADQARIVWTESGQVEHVSAGEEAYALAYEMADLERAVAGDKNAQQLIEVAADVMDLMTQLRYEWGVYYPEEGELAAAKGMQS